MMQLGSGHEVRPQVITKPRQQVANEGPKAEVDQSHWARAEIMDWR